MVEEFNIVLNKKEKRRGRKVWDPFREHTHYLLSNWDLIEAKPMRGQYTWSNRILGPRYIVP